MTRKIAFAGIVFLCIKYYCTIVHNRTKLQIFTYFHNQKQKKLHTRTYFNMRKALFSTNAIGRIVQLAGVMKRIQTRRGKEKLRHIYLFTEIITIFATQVE